ncbi:MAG: hypothetical protein DA408_01515 [Bacteroidetes bacterium]|nr:MAG: hypothetical protein C7N36_02525 [Bacteroidota bacterium]PTM14723.1 MAG: hypothetical protein DA408_01515 [Bacteroidota bacterium]
MISLQRLQIDGWVQLGLGILGFIAWSTYSLGLGLLALWVLWLWQTGSALELWLDYHHRSRRWYLWVAPLLLLGYFLYEELIILLLLFIVIYAWHTLRDYLIVRRRPRSFWDL